jgi:hypothetical protein
VGLEPGGDEVLHEGLVAGLDGDLERHRVRADLAPVDLGEGALERADQQLLGDAGRGGGRGAARHGAAGQREPQQRRDRGAGDG